MTKARLVREHRGLWTASIALVTALGGCGGDGASVKCGEGTRIKGGECVPSQADSDGGGGEDVVEDAGTLSCGAGTMASNGECVPTSSVQLKCGAGTVEDAGVCLVAPAAPPSIQGLKVSHVALRAQGTLLVDGSELSQFYPVEVSIGLTYSGDKADIPVVFALGEVPAAGKTEANGICLVGGFDVHHPGGATATESIATGTMYVPKECLKATEAGRIVSPLVLVDPDGVVAGEDAEGVSRSVAFLKLNADDPEVAACRRDPTPSGDKGTCQVEMKVKASPGIDFELAELSLESAVTVLDRCAAKWAEIADGTASVDLDRPVSYRCNKNIVPEFQRNAMGEIVKDGSGNPLQATYVNSGGATLPKWVYGAADVSVDVTVIARGKDDSIVKTADQAMAGGKDEKKLVNNALADHGLQIVYHVRPAQSALAEWKPLYLHAEGEQAKAGEAGESGQTPAQFEETEVIPETPHYYTHGLYVENDCGERNKSTCKEEITPRNDIIYGTWSTQTDFVVRACLVPVDESGAEDKAIDVNSSNDCKEIPLKIVRHATGGAAANASSYGFNYQFKDGVGSQDTLRLGWDLHTWNNINTGGVTIDNEASMVLGSNLIGSTDILKGWAKGAAYVSLVGSYYDYGLSTFGVKLWGDAKEVPEYHWEKDWNVTKELRRGMILWAGPVPVNVEIRFTGQAGLVVNLDIVGVNKPFTADEESETYLLERAGNATRIGLATLTVTPYGNMVVVASASLSAAAARVGVAGQLTLMDLRTPLSGRLWWGMTNLNPVQLRTGAWADLKLTFTTMKGRVYLFAEHWDIKWCKKKIAFVKVKYPCGEEWNTFWDYTIADWGGWTWNQTLWASPYKDYTIP
jgi:hypothetical protein